MDLPAEVRGEVERLAKLGQPHPDSDIALAARAWAVEYLAEHGWPSAVGALVGDLGGALLTPGYGATPSASFPNFILARHLVALDG